MTTYTIPEGDQVPFPFGGASYLIPAGDQVAFRFGGVPGQVFAVGFNAQVFGSASVGNAIRQLFPAGINDGVVNGNVVVIKSHLVSGFDATLWGTPSLENRTQIVTFVGFDASLYGAPTIDYRDRNVHPAGSDYLAMGTDITLSGGVRQVFAVGVDTEAFGTTTITLATRQVFPQWFATMVFGTPTLGFDRTAQPSGWDSASFGTLFINSNRQWLYPFGVATDRYGETIGVDYRLKFIKPNGILEEGLFATPKVYCQTQYITANYHEGDWYLPNGAVGDHAATNVNRVIDLVNNGIAPLFRQVPLTHQIANNARAVQAPGFDATLFGAGTFIAYRNRTIVPEGFEPPPRYTYHNVYNAAGQLLPHGWDSAAVGTPPLVQNTRRYLSGGYTLQDTSLYGLPFVAYGRRSLAPAVVSIAGGTYGEPTVGLAVRTITPSPWLFPNPFGTALVETRRNILKVPSMALTYTWGDTHVTNRTPEVGPYWDSSSFTRFGATAVANRNNYLPVESLGDLLTLGATQIDYRRKLVLTPGFDALRFNPFASIRNELPDPPGVQYVPEASVGDTSSVPFPLLTNYALFVGGIEGSVFGSATLTKNNLLPMGITPPYDETGQQVGTPSLNGPQFISVPTLGDSMQLGAVSCSPLTIWAPDGAPEAAQQSNPGHGEPMDYFLHGGAGMPVWGDTHIDLKNRVILAGQGSNDGSFGLPTLFTRPIYVTLPGILSYKTGIPVLNNPGNINLYDTGAQDQWGTPSVAIIEPFIRHLYPLLADQLLFGSTWIALFNRTLPLAGWDQTGWGTTIVQRPPPPAEPAGLDATLFGAATFIAYRIRHVNVEGDDMFVTGWEVGGFKDRMTVHGQAGIGPTGFASLAMGTPSFDHHDRSIAPLPASDRDRFGTPGVLARNIVALASYGWASQLFGEAWALPVTPGTVQPRGDDTLAFGNPRITYVVQPSGLTGAVGTPGAANSLGVYGFDAAQWAEPVAMGFGCGRQARALRGFDATAFGQATIG